MKTDNLSRGASALRIAAVILVAVMVADTGAEYSGEYAESRTGRMENGQIRYVKNELYYFDPEEYGLSSDLPDGTSIYVYFDENDNVVACINGDVAAAAKERNVIGALIGMAVWTLSDEGIQGLKTEMKSC